MRNDKTPASKGAGVWKIAIGLIFALNSSDIWAHPARVGGVKFVSGSARMGVLSNAHPREIMKLYVTHFSPFARTARIVRREKQLEDRVEEIMAVTRKPDSPYYQINPSGRVPYLLRDDGVGIEGSQPVCFVLDHLAGAPTLETPAGEAGLEHRRLEERARSVMDSASVWIRELGRPQSDRSDTVIEHERQRMNRLADFWQAELDHPLMTGELNMPQVTLACAFLVEQFFPGLAWREGRPRLAAWVDRFAKRESFLDTRPHKTLEP